MTTKTTVVAVMLMVQCSIGARGEEDGNMKRIGARLPELEMNPLFSRGVLGGRKDADTDMTNEFIEENIQDEDDVDSTVLLETPSWWHTHHTKKKSSTSRMQPSHSAPTVADKPREVRRQAPSADYSKAPLFRFRADRDGHGANRMNYRGSGGGFRMPNVQAAPGSFEDFFAKDARQRFGGLGEEHPLLSILDRAGIGSGGDASSFSLLQENMKSTHKMKADAARPFGLRSAQGQTYGQMRQAAAANAGNGNGNFRFASNGGDPTSSGFGSNMMHQQMNAHPELQDMNTANPSIGAVQPGALKSAGPSGGDPFGGSMPAPAAPSYTYSSVSSAAGNGRPAPPPPPPPVPMPGRQSRSPSAPPSIPASTHSGASSTNVMLKGGPSVPSVSRGPGAGQSDSMPEMPSGLNLKFLPRFKESSAKIVDSGHSNANVHGAAAYVNGGHPTPPLPKRPPRA
eukprot:g879.t1